MAQSPIADATPAIPPDRQLIQGYDAAGFTITGVRHRGSVIVFPERTIAWAVADPAALTLDDLEPIRAAAAGIDILLIGTGATFRFVPPALRAAVRAWGPVADAMATPAACRTYNVLLAEERRVAAALVMAGEG